MCASWGLARSISRALTRNEVSPTYLLQCAMETVHLGGYENRLLLGKTQSFGPLSGRWDMIQDILKHGGKCAILRIQDPTLFRVYQSDHDIVMPWIM